MENSISSDHLVSHFRKSVAENSLFHSYLILGSDFEMLEQTISQIIEQIFSKTPSSSMRKKIAEKIHPDITEIKAEGKNISIEQVRNILESAAIKPWESTHKIFILYNVEKMSIEAANSLLKILEEPPQHILFILTAENTAHIPDTILSRCQLFKLENQGVQNTSQALITKHSIPEHKAIVAANLSDGNIGTALDILENYWEGRDCLLHIISCQDDPISIGETIVSHCGTSEEGRQKSKRFIHYLCSILRDLIIIKATTDTEKYIMNSDFCYQMEKSAPLYSIYQLQLFIDQLLKFLRMVESNVSLNLIWENIALYAVKLKAT